jgi:hypothetical protein
MSQLHGSKNTINFGGWHCQVGNDCRQAFGAPYPSCHVRNQSFRRQTRRARTKKSPRDTTNAAPADVWRSPTPTTHTARLHAVSPVAGRPPCPCSIDLPPPRPVFRIVKSRADLRSLPLRHGARRRCCRARRQGMAAHTPDPARAS